MIEFSAGLEGRGQDVLRQVERSSVVLGTRKFPPCLQVSEIPPAGNSRKSVMLSREKARRGPAVPLSGDQWAGIEVTAGGGGPLPGRLAQSAVVLQSRTLAP